MLSIILPKLAELLPIVLVYFIINVITPRNPSTTAPPLSNVSPSILAKILIARANMSNEALNFTIIRPKDDTSVLMLLATAANPMINPRNPATAIPPLAKSPPDIPPRILAAAAIMRIAAPRLRRLVDNLAISLVSTLAIVFDNIASPAPIATIAPTEDHTLP